MIRLCASVPTGQDKSGASSYVPSAPTHEDGVQAFRQAGLGGAHLQGRRAPERWAWGWALGSTPKTSTDFSLWVVLTPS